MDWETNETLILLNPRLPPDEAEGIQKLLRAFSIRGHVWLATSGSTAASLGEMKWTALSKEALLTSAAAVNSFLDSTEKDIWLNPLPSFHVGGLGIEARAHLSGAQVVEFKEKWEAARFASLLCESHATLLSLVPAQLFDLVALKAKPPSSLRAVIVGGGALQEPLYRQAVALGWNLLPSYGLTECSSQVATAHLAQAGSEEMPPLHLLSHVEAKISSRGCLELKSRALLTCYAFQKEGKFQLFDPKNEGWFETEDRAILEEDRLKLLGRETSFVKIGGESCDLLRLERILEELKLQHSLTLDLALVAIKDERLGHVIHMAAAAATADQIDPVVDAFQKRVLPFERVRKIHYFPSLPRTALSKLIVPELTKWIEYEN